MLLGSGVKGKGGTLLLYESGSLLEGAIYLFAYFNIASLRI